jgi:hypothetical protein
VIDEAERVAAFLLAGVQQRWGRLWDGGPRMPCADRAAAQTSALPSAVGTSALRILASRRVRGITDVVRDGLIAWQREGRPVDVITKIPTARQVLARQARGRRCVSLIADDVAAAHGDPRHPDGLRFALHDLEHLEKFVAPEHHAGQVGFFRAVERSFASPGFAAVQAEFDDTWCADRDYVISDMNGSAIFLFAVLKMKVLMAVRRQHERAHVIAPSVPDVVAPSGPLSPAEHARAAPAIDALIRGFGLPPDAEAAAFAVSARRDHPAAAQCLLAGFEALAGVDARDDFSACAPASPAS